MVSAAWWRVAASLRHLGSGHAPVHRFRVGLEFAVSGYRDLDGMITQHAELARSLAAELGLPAAVQESIGASYERWDGHGWPGDLRGASVPLPSRLAQLAEYIEVAYRIGGEKAAVTLARKRRGSQFDPELADLICDEASGILAGLSDAPSWDAVIGAEPALVVTLSSERLDAALLGVANFVDLKSPYMLGQPARSPASRLSQASSLAWTQMMCNCCGAPPSSLAWAGSVSRTRSGISLARWAQASESGYVCTLT